MSRLTSTHPNSNSNGTRFFFFSEVKRQGREVNHLPPFNAEVRIWCGATFTRPMRLIGVKSKDFTVLCVFRLASFVATNFPIYIFQDKIQTAMTSVQSLKSETRKTTLNSAICTLTLKSLN